MADGRARYIVALEPSDVERLKAWAKAEERAPDQQATWIVRVALRSLEVTEVEPLELQLPVGRVA